MMLARSSKDVLGFFLPNKLNRHTKTYPKTGQIISHWHWQGWYPQILHVWIVSRHSNSKIVGGMKSYPVVGNRINHCEDHYMECIRVLLEIFSIGNFADQAPFCQTYVCVHAQFLYGKMSSVINKTPGCLGYMGIIWGIKLPSCGDYTKLYKDHD